MSTTEAYRHEGVGLVERAQQTLLTMTRVCNEGAAHWVDHLPFLLMSMRATAGRVVPKSPAAILYLVWSGASSYLLTLLLCSSCFHLDLHPCDAVTYTHELNKKLLESWRSALESTQEAQRESMRSASQNLNSVSPITFIQTKRQSLSSNPWPRQQTSVSLLRSPVPTE